MRWFTLSLTMSLLAALTQAAPPNPPPDFAQPQSPAKPTPFPVKFIDQGQFDSRLKGYQTPEGFKLEIVATDPVVVNPVGMTFSPDGTLFVIEWTPDPGREWYEFKETFRYRDGSTKQVATMKKFVSDPVKIVRYNATSRTFDRSDVILTDELPSSILHHDGWIYLSSRGTVRRYRQSKPGGQWDVREVIAQGFCGFHHHQVSGMTIGNDGMLYITSGDDDNFVEGSDGSRATVLRTGAVFRCKPDGSQMETFSLGYRNPYRDIAHDDRFNWFHSDNDNEDGSRFTGCRLMHIPEGVDYGWRLFPGARCCRPDNLRGAVAGERPGMVAPMAKTGRGSPAGVLIYHDTRLPTHYRGLMYYPDVYRRIIRAYQLKQNASTFAIAGELELLKSEDPLFRPCQMVTGPDGAIYICDWRTDSGGAGKLWGDGVHGRIYRLTWSGTAQHPAIPVRGMDSWANILRAPDDDLVAKLGAPDMTDRLAARNELVRRGAKSRALVMKRFVSGTLSADGRLPAMGVLQNFWNDDVADLFRLLTNDESPDVRRLAVDGLGHFTKRANLSAQDALTRLLADADHAVRRAACIALSRLGGEGSADAIVNAWKHDDGKDAFLADGYLRAFEKLGKPGMDALLAVADSGDHRERDRVAVAFTGLRSRAAADALGKLVANAHLTPGQRADLVRAYSNFQFDPPMSLEPLAEFVTSRPNESEAVRSAALEVLAGDAGALTGSKATRYVLGLLDAPEPEVRASAIYAVEQARLTQALPKLLAMLADGKRLAPERLRVAQAIRVTGDASAVPLLQELLTRPEPAAFKAELLRSLAVIDVGAARAIAEKLLDQTDTTLLAEAIVALGTSRDGAKLLGERYLAKKLPREQWPRISESLKKFAGDPAIAKLTADATKGAMLLSMQPGEIEKIRQLVASKGDPKKGKDLYLTSTQLGCATCHRLEGVGGQVGPDLTRLWDTHSVEKIMESIVLPSKEIKEGYQSYRASTFAGQVFTGLKISETPKEVLLRDATGRDIRLARADIEELTASKVSLMPDDAISQITFDQFIDLLAFLKSRSAQESLRGAVLEYSVALGFEPDLKKALPPESVALGAPPVGAWQTLPVDVAGLLQLKPHLPSQAKGAYALTYLYSAKKQTVNVALLADDPMRIWAGKTLAFERDVVKHSPFAEAEKFNFEVQPGWTPILVKLVSTGQTHRLGLQFVGEGLRTATKPDAK